MLLVYRVASIRVSQSVVDLQGQVFPKDTSSAAKLPPGFAKLPTIRASRLGIQSFYSFTTLQTGENKELALCVLFEIVEELPHS